MRSIYKRPGELAAMLPSCELTAAALDAVQAAIAPGVRPLELDAIAERVIREAGAVPNFQLVDGYHHTICASVNDVVVHGIPGDTPLAPGDIISVDCGAKLDGWNGDSARTFIVPGDSAHGEAWDKDARRVSAAAQAAMWAGIAAVATARHLADVSAAIADTVQAHRAGGPLGNLEGYTGHGIGRDMHEDPPVYNTRMRRRGPVVRAGLAICIEPMLTAGSPDVHTDADGWSVRANDGTPSAHWEHTVLRHDGGIWVATAPDGGAAGLAAHGITPVRPRG